MVRKILILALSLCLLDIAHVSATDWRYVCDGYWKSMLTEHYIDMDSIVIDYDDGSSIDFHLFHKVILEPKYHGARAITYKEHSRKRSNDKYIGYSLVIAHDDNGNPLFNSGEQPVNYRPIIPDTVEDWIFNLVYDSL